MHPKFKQIIDKRRYPTGPKEHEQVVNIVHHHANTRMARIKRPITPSVDKEG